MQTRAHMLLSDLDQAILRNFKEDVAVTELSLLLLPCSDDADKKAENERLFNELVNAVVEKKTVGTLKFGAVINLEVVPPEYHAMLELLVAKSPSIFQYIYQHSGHVKTPAEIAHCERVAKILAEKKSSFKKLPEKTSGDQIALLDEIHRLLVSLSSKYAPLLVIYPEQAKPLAFFQRNLIIYILSLNGETNIANKALVLRSQLRMHLMEMTLRDDKTSALYQSLEESVAQLENLLVKISVANKKFEWECFLSNSSQLSQSWSNDDKQEKFAQNCYVSVLSAVNFINREITNLTAKKLYEFLADHRKDIAHRLNQPDKYYIGGSMRDINLGETPIAPGHYTDYVNDLTQRLRQFVQKENPTFEQDGYIKVKVPVHDKAGKVTRMTDGIQIKCENILLSRLAFKLLGERDGFPHSEIDPQYGEIPHINPADVKLLHDVFARIEKPFQTILNSRQPTIENLICIAIMAYFLAHIMALVRGSAATTEMTVYSLFEISGFPMVPNQACIPLDLEALFEPKLDIFIGKFLNQFFPALKEFALQFKQSNDAAPRA